MNLLYFLPDFNRSQRWGILLLLSIIFLGQIGIWSFNNIDSVSNESPEIPKDLQQQYDSLKKLALQKRQPKIYPFNPNYLTDYKGYFLGLTPQQIDKVSAFRQTGRYFQSKQEFKQVAGLSDSLFQKLSPYINIPEYKFKNNTHQHNHKQLTTNDMNLATAKDLQSINGIGPVLSKRIVKYRKAIGGFKDWSQLQKVYGLKPEVITKIQQKFVLKPNTKLIEKPVVKKPINTATADDLQQIYGIGEKLARRIIKYRESIGGFTIKEQVNAVYGLRPETIEQLWNSFKIAHPAKIKIKIDLNDANIKELAKNPYISYQLAKKIVSYRTLHGAFHNFADLLKVPDYPADKHKLISLYLKL